MTRQPIEAPENRARQIAEVLTRHGLGYLVSALGLERFIPFHRGLLGHPRREEPYTSPEHLRMGLEELGATFIKLGQILSTRADLLPPVYQHELVKLQDHVPAVSFAAIRALVEAELGQPLEQLFADFDPVPLAAASIGQAHAATLRDGSEVVVKVRRPGISACVTADLDMLRSLAQAASRQWELAEHYDLVGLAREFAQTLEDELDYEREARTVERFAANFAADPSIHIPRVIHDRSTAQVLTLERIRGMKVTDTAALDAVGIDRPALARRATEAVLKMIFDDGIFHADLHPGNLFIEPNGRIGLIDFGMIGTLDNGSQDQLASVLLAVVSGDIGRLTDGLLALGFARQRVDRARLEQDITQLLDQYTGKPLGSILIGPLLEETFATIRRQRLLLPPNLALLFKTLIMSEGMGAQLDPDFHLTSVLVPYAKRLMLRQYTPQRLAHQLRLTASDLVRLSIDAPPLLRRLLGEIERGGIELRLSDHSIEPVLRRAERIANRLVLGIIMAAFIVGLAVLMAVYHPWDSVTWLGMFFAIGFAVALALGAYLAWSIVRSGRRS